MGDDGEIGLTPRAKKVIKLAVEEALCGVLWERSRLRAHPLNRLTSVTFLGSRTVSYTYSNVGNRATITYPGGSNQVTYGYDAANNLTSVTDWNSQQTTYAYNNAGMLTTAALPTSTGVVGTYSYDNADRLTGVSWDKGGNTLASANYTLNAASNRTQRVDQAGTHTYSYDALHQLTSVTYPGPSTDNYTYDAVGNRLTKTGVTGGYTYDAADRMTAAGGVSYGYDSNGSLTSRGSDSFAWNAANRMTTASVGGTTTTFAYNGTGLRDSRTTGGNTATFTWDILSGVPQILDDGTFKHVYGLGQICEIGPGTTTHYYLPDGLGSTMALVDSTGGLVNTYNYDVYGDIRSSTGSQANEYQFAGEQVDGSTGLQYLRERYYDMATGRFLGLDPLGGGYPYTGNNPVNRIDPSGLDWVDCDHIEGVNEIGDPHWVGCEWDGNNGDPPQCLPGGLAFGDGSCGYGHMNEPVGSLESPEPKDFSWLSAGDLNQNERRCWQGIICEPNLDHVRDLGNLVLGVRDEVIDSVRWFGEREIEVIESVLNNPPCQQAAAEVSAGGALGVWMYNSGRRIPAWFMVPSVANDARGLRGVC